MQHIKHPWNSRCARLYPISSVTRIFYTKHFMRRCWTSVMIPKAFSLNPMSQVLEERQQWTMQLQMSKCPNLKRVQIFSVSQLYLIISHNISFDYFHCGRTTNDGWASRGDQYPLNCILVISEYWKYNIILIITFLCLRYEIRFFF